MQAASTPPQSSQVLSLERSREFKRSRAQDEAEPSERKREHDKVQWAERERLVLNPKFGTQSPASTRAEGGEGGKGGEARRDETRTEAQRSNGAEEALSQEQTRQIKQCGDD